MTPRPTPRKHWSELIPGWLWGPEPEPVPLPNRERVVRRLIVRLALGIKSDCAHSLREPDPEKPEDPKDLYDLIAEAESWIREQAPDDVAASERAFLELPPEEWTPQMLIDGSWLGQGTWPLAWSLGLCPHVEKTESFSPFSLSIAPYVSVAEILEEINPIPFDDVVFETGVYRAMLWRVRAEDRKYVEEGTEDMLRDLERFANELAKSGAFEPPVNGDISFGGVPFHDLPDSDKYEISSYATERLRAFNWLQGQDEIWDLITNDT